MTEGSCVKTMRGIITRVIRRKGRVGLVWLKHRQWSDRILARSGDLFMGTPSAAGVCVGLPQNVIDANRRTRTTGKRGGS